jgi:uncharacterized C2H2 Zn-finger protein
MAAGSDFWSSYLAAAAGACDVQLVPGGAGGQARPAHSLLLAGASALLRALLLQRPACPCGPAVILLPDFSPEEVDHGLAAITGSALSGGSADGAILRALGLEGGLLGEECKEEVKEEVKVKGEVDWMRETDSDREVYSPLGSDWLEQDFACDHCDKEFKTNKRMMCHISLAHSGVSGDKKAPRRKLHELQEELQELQEEPPRKSKKKTKQIYPSDSKEPIICDLCGNVFKGKRSLQLHTKRVHWSEQEKKARKTHVCATCGKGFYSKYNLTDHEFIHIEGPNSHFCDQCEWTGKTKNALRIHTNRIHLGNWALSEEKRVKQNKRKIERRAEMKERNGGCQRTPEEKVKFNEYMKNWTRRKKEKDGMKAILEDCQF